MVVGLEHAAVARCSKAGGARCVEPPACPNGDGRRAWSAQPRKEGQVPMQVVILGADEIVGFWRGVYTRFWSEVLRLLRQSDLTELQALKECTAICLGLGTAIACRSFHGPGGAHDFKGVWALTCECWSGSRTLSLTKSVSPCLTCLCSPGKRIS